MAIPFFPGAANSKMAQGLTSPTTATQVKAGVAAALVGVVVEEEEAVEELGEGWGDTERMSV